jgi:ATP-dependent exoDNAse (exonuclease V) beta subunit
MSEEKLEESKKKIIKLSASSIGTFDKCPKKYHYRYIEKPDVPETDWSFLEFGKCAHAALEYFHQHLMDNVEKPEDYGQIMRESFMKALKEYNLEILRDELPYLKEILQDYLDVILKDGLPHVISAELSFNFKIGEYVVRGFIDRIDKIGPGEYHVVDYKTNKNPKYLTNFQLLLYALAIKEQFPDAKIIHGSYVLLKHKSKLKSWSFTEKDYQDTIDKVMATGQSIDTNTFWEKRPSVLCNWCDYKSICQDAWTEDNDNLC